MRQGKKPTVAQRRHLESINYDSNDWLVIKWEPTDIVIKHRETGEVKHLSMFD